MLVLVSCEDRILYWHPGTRCLVFFQRMQFVQLLDEQQVAQVLKNGEWIGDTAGPHRVPDAVDIGLSSPVIIVFLSAPSLHWATTH